MGSMTSNQSWEPECSTKILKLFPTTNTVASFMHNHQGKTNSCPFITSLYSWSFERPGELKYISISRASDWKKNTVQLRSSSFHLYMSFMSPVQSLLSTYLFLFLFQFVLGPFFPSGHCPLPFVHNVRLFIFHSCLLPCLLYFLLPLSFFGKKRDVY